MQALVLAAGMGKRLHKEINKCMVEINGKSLWKRTIDALKKANIEKVIIVTGYHAEQLENYIMQFASEMEIHFVRNVDYETTNNIWSLYLANDYFQEDTLLLESDLIYDEELLKKICDLKTENIAVVDRMAPWMDGTTVSLKNDKVTNIIPKKEISQYDVTELYKTVNIYKFSKDFLNAHYISYLNEYISTNGKNEYYEMALKSLVKDKNGILSAYVIEEKWYEIDTEDDLKVAEQMFS